MSKPMYCPMSFNNYTPNLTRCDGVVEKQMYMFECTPDCAWVVKNEYHDIYMCAVALKYAELSDYAVNARPLKDDVE